MNGTVKTRWTLEDEARLVELQDRKRRNMKEYRGPILDIVLIFTGISAPLADDFTDFLILEASAMRQALEPFDLNQALERTRK